MEKAYCPDCGFEMEVDEEDKASEEKIQCPCCGGKFDVQVLIDN